MLLSRAIFIIDANDIIRYIQRVPEVTSEPDYSAEFTWLKEIIPPFIPARFCLKIS
jgi:thioredoxin-dependent peroxiredoxin